MKQCLWCHRVVHDDRDDFTTSKWNICAMARENFRSGMSVEFGLAKLDALEPASEVSLCPFRSIPLFLKNLLGRNMVKPGNVFIQLAFYHMLRSNKCVPSSSPSSRVTNPSN